MSEIILRSNNASACRSLFKDEQPREGKVPVNSNDENGAARYRYHRVARDITAFSVSAI